MRCQTGKALSPGLKYARRGMTAGRPILSLPPLPAASLLLSAPPVQYLSQQRRIIRTELRLQAYLLLHTNSAAQL
jgi:hypothetical protein